MKSVILLLILEINKTITSCLESYYDFFCGWSQLLSHLALPKDILDLQGLKVFMVSTDTSRLTFGCGASTCVATDVFQLPQAPPEEPLQEKFLPGVFCPCERRNMTIPNIQRGVPHPTVLTSLSHCSSFCMRNSCKVIFLTTSKPELML